VISSHQAGVAQVVATAGTAMTENHLRSLSRLAHDIRFCFDGDRAGIAATERAIGIASNLSLKLGIITLSDGAKDPDELIKISPEKWLQAIDAPQDALEWLLDRYQEQFDLSTAEGKRQATTKALAVIRNLSDPVEQEHYVQLLSARTGASVNAIQAKFNGLPDEQVLRRKIRAETVNMGSHKDAFLYQDHLLSLLLVYPELRDVLTTIQAEDFETKQRQEIFRFIVKLGQHQVSDGVLESLQFDDIRVKIKELELIAEQKYDTIESSYYFVAVKLVKRVQIDKKTKQKNEFAKVMAATEDAELRRTQNLAYSKLIK
jgi:DNA primase